MTNGIKFIKTTSETVSATSGWDSLYSVEHTTRPGLAPDYQRIGSVARSGKKWFYLTRDGHRGQPETTHPTRALAAAALVSAWENYGKRRVATPATDRLVIKPVSVRVACTNALTAAMPAPDSAETSKAPTFSTDGNTDAHGNLVWSDSKPVALAKPWHGIERPAVQCNGTSPLMDDLLAKSDAYKAAGEPGRCSGEDNRGVRCYLSGGHTGKCTFLVLVLLLLCLAPMLTACATQATRTQDTLAAIQVRTVDTRMGVYRVDYRDGAKSTFAMIWAQSTADAQRSFHHMFGALVVTGVSYAPAAQQVDAAEIGAVTADVNRAIRESRYCDAERADCDDTDTDQSGAAAPSDSDAKLDCNIKVDADCAFVDRVEGSKAVLLMGAEGSIETTVDMVLLPVGTREGDTIVWRRSGVQILPIRTVR